MVGNNRKLGETNINYQKKRMAILNDRGPNDIDVIFEKDNAIVNTTYMKFLDGNVKNPGANTDDTWEHTVVTDATDQEAMIVEYYDDDNVTVQYGDGRFIAGLKLDDVLAGKFSYYGTSYSKTDAGRTLKDHRKRTREFATFLLNRYRRCVIIRPCGFGKTYIGMEILESGRYQRCLFLHPDDDDSKAEEVRKRKPKKVVHSHTFNWIRGLSNTEIAALDYDLVFIDEVHCIGGTDDGKGAYITYQKIKKLMETHPKTHFLGATATPERMDGIDVIGTMFDDHCCYPYDMEDALEDGLLKKPHYYYCVYDVVKKIRDKIEEARHEKIGRKELMDLLSYSEEEINEIDSKYMDKHIRKVCNKLLPGKKYMRFIAFYLTHDLIDENKEKVIGWFEKAYPTYQIGTIEVSSRSKKDLKAVDELPTEPTEPGYDGRIDIIFNCEKLCMGYHSKLITGLILDRKTYSSTKYFQMTGRLMTFEEEDEDNPDRNVDPVIIFDVADNIHNDFVCNSPILQKVEQVIANFDINPKTFKELIKKYPNARHWEKINACAKKAQEGQKIADAIKEQKNEDKGTGYREEPEKANNGERGTINPVNATVKESEPTRMPVNKRETDNAVNTGKKTEPVNAPISDDLREKTAKAAEIAKKRNITPEEAADLVTGIKKEDETVDTKEIGHEKFDPQPRPYGGRFGNFNPCNNAQSERKTLTKEQEEEDYLSNARAKYGYDLSTKTLTSKYVILENRYADIEKDYMRAYNRQKEQYEKEQMDRIIKRWKEFFPNEDIYRSYSDVDKKSIKFRMLESISRHEYHAPHVEHVIKYMIEVLSKTAC